MDKEDTQIDKGQVAPIETEYLHAKDVLDVLSAISENKEFQRPRGRYSPQFSLGEVHALAELLFFKPRHIVLKEYKRVPRERELTLKRRLFVDHLFGEAQFNGARAARLAGYSARSAKQIAYKLKQS